MKHDLDIEAISQGFYYLMLYLTTNSLYFINSYIAVENSGLLIRK